jgi:hypothetical protein
MVPNDALGRNGIHCQVGRNKRVEARLILYFNFSMTVKAWLINPSVNNFVGYFIATASIRKHEMKA